MDALVPSLTNASRRITADGKFLQRGAERFIVKGITYGTFAPDPSGYQFPSIDQVRRDFAAMRALGINTVRIYTEPAPALLEEAAAHDLQVMVGVWWPQHVAFLDQRHVRRQIRHEVVRQIRTSSSHAAAFLFALANEIPASVVRWHGHGRVERFLHELYDEAKNVAPESLFTCVNYPPTEYLDLSCFDVCAFNVYLHRDTELRAYWARLQHLAGPRPLLLAEAGADGYREGEAAQGRLTAMQLDAALSAAACGAIAFAWTDDWWCGGYQVEDWSFGLTTRDRKPKPLVADAVAAVFSRPLPPSGAGAWPRVSVVVCAYNAAETIADCLRSLACLRYPDFETILVNDGSRDATAEIAHGFPSVRLIEVNNSGLSAARNIGLRQATGAIVAYTDADVRVDRDWLTYLIQPFLTSNVVGVGGPNVVPANDPPMAQCVARAPGAPTHVLLDDHTAEHIPGCNMAFRREALLAIDGFDRLFVRAGDDVDVCWRLQANGGRLAFAPAALVWHLHRRDTRAYWRQQVGYGEGEAWLQRRHPDKFVGRHIAWRGSIYSPLPFLRRLVRDRVDTGIWGTAAFPSIYRVPRAAIALLPNSAMWQIAAVVLLLVAAVQKALRMPIAAATALVAAMMLATTALACVWCAVRSDINSLGPVHRLPRWATRLWYRAVIAWLHFLQPLARARGWMRGILAWTGSATSAPQPNVLSIIQRAVSETLFWAEASDATADQLLTTIVARLRTRRVAPVLIAPPTQADHDISIGLGGWGRLRLRMLVEQHGYGKCLARIRHHVQLTAWGALVAVGAGVALLTVSRTTGPAAHWLRVLALTVVTPIIWRCVVHASRVLNIVHSIVGDVLSDSGFVVLGRNAQPEQRRHPTEQPV